MKYYCNKFPYIFSAWIMVGLVFAIYMDAMGELHYNEQSRKFTMNIFGMVLIDLLILYALFKYAIHKKDKGLEIK